MRISQVLFAVLIVFGLQSKVSAQDACKTFTLYLIRHAEKELSADNPKDPPLTECGEQRAESLAAFLASVDLDAVYSSDYLRTKNTAGPVTKSKGIELQIYDPGKLDDLVQVLMEQKQDALVIGHSNSTPALAGLILGQEFESIDESLHDRIYQIVICGEQARLHLLHSTFVCSLEEE
jgi:broad specificity phosphatase PhoE